MRSNAPVSAASFDVPAVDAHALVVAQQVRRGEGAGAQARGPRDRLDEGDRGALAVGAAHRHDQRARPAAAQGAHALAHALQAHGDLLRMGAQLVVQPLVERACHRCTVGAAFSRRSSDYRD
jgi:hypothetical protein